MKKDGKKRIGDALCTLAKGRPIEEISISDIIRTAGVNRATFYYHFTDVPSVLRYMMESFIETYLGIFRHSAGQNSANMDAALRRQVESELCDYVCASADDIHFFFEPQNYFLFHELFRKHFYDYARRYRLVLARSPEDSEPIKRGIIYDYATYCLFSRYWGLLEHWAERDFSETAEDWVSILSYIAAGVITLEG